VVPVRLPKEVLVDLDKWAESHETESRSEAIRILLEQALAVARKPRRARPKAD